jgi:hypothetical protein
VRARARRSGRTCTDFAIEPLRRATFVIDELLARLDQPANADVVRSILSDAPSLSAHWYVLMRYGTWEENSQQPQLDMLSPEESRKARRALATLVMNADPESLARESDLLRLAATVADTAPGGRADAATLLADER